MRHKRRPSRALRRIHKGVQTESMKAIRVREFGAPQVMVLEEMPLADAPRAHYAVMQPGAYDKIVLIP